MNRTVYRNAATGFYQWLFVAAVLVGLYLTTLVNYLLFHSIIELFSIIIACTVFIITWNSLQYIKNQYLLVVGIASLFIGILDLLHTLGFKGMAVFPDYDYYANQLWIAARYLESLTLLASFVLLRSRREVRPGYLFTGYLVVTSLVVASIFYWKTFPICFIEGRGQTPFKIYSEYVICAILTGGLVMLYRSRGFFTATIHRLLALSILFAILSELCFTMYVDNYGISNMAGHFFKLFAFLMIYRAIVSTGMEDPYRLIFKELTQSNESLQKEIELRKVVETERERAYASLRESEERYRSLFESIPAAVLLTIPGGPIVAANPAACAMFGLTEEELLERGRDGLLCPDDPRTAPAFAERDRTGRFVNVELCYLRKNGERFPGETDSVILPGDPPRAFVIVRDITTRKETEAALQELNQELERRVAERTAELHQKDQLLLLQGRQAAMGEMIGHIAHQWRQPLNSLALLIQDIMLTHELGEVTPEYLQGHVDKGMELIQHMSGTIEDFRNFFRPDREKALFKVNEVLAKTLSLVEGTLKQQRIEVEVTTEGDPAMDGFANEFSQVLLNIIVNAKDALAERQVAEPKVAVRTAQQGDRAVVTITDNAGGIPAEVLPHVFDPYFTTKGAKQGTGVGLSMSRTIIEKNMGGTLSVRNVAGGAEFTIEVPAGPGHGHEPA